MAAGERKPSATSEEAGDVDRLIGELERRVKSVVPPSGKTPPQIAATSTSSAATSSLPIRPTSPVAPQPMISSPAPVRRSAFARAFPRPAFASPAFAGSAAAVSGGRFSLFGYRILAALRPPDPGAVSIPMGPLAVWSCVGLGVLLGIVILRWPYERSCGVWLLFYLLSVGMVLVAGVWGAWHAWDSRLGVAHIVALATVLWGCALTAQEVLPRIGYARSTAAWLCTNGHRFLG